MNSHNVRWMMLGAILLLISNAVYAAVEQKAYILNLKYDEGIITKEDLKVIPGEAPDRRIQPKIGYLLELISFNNETLYSFKFNFPLEKLMVPPANWFDENGNQVYIPKSSEVRQRLDVVIITLVIPYFKNGKTISIYDPNNTKVLAIDVGYFADVCPDNICEPHESYENCPRDCPSGQKDDYCDKISDGICDPDCITGDSDCETKKIDYLAITVVSFILLLVAISIYLKMFRRKFEKE